MLRGIGTSKGIGIGKALIIHKCKNAVSRVKIKDTEAEVDKFNEAVEKFIQETNELVDKLSQKLNGDDKNALVLKNQEYLIRDPEFTSGVISAITNDKLNAEAAVEDTCEMLKNIFLGFNNDTMTQRVADIEDMKQRLIAIMQGQKHTDLTKLSDNTVIIADEIHPSMTANMDTEHIAGIISEKGGDTSHASILARALEIPAVLSVKDICSKIAEGEEVIVDGAYGEVFVNPTPITLKIYNKKKKAYDERVKELKKYIDKQTVTRDGRKVMLAANIGNADEAAKAVKAGAEGVGLFRTEFLFMNKQALPTEEEQYNEYKKAAVVLDGRQLTIRTLDIGGDKDIPYMGLTKELNPFLGYRAIRFCLDRVDIFTTQLRAVLRASAYGNIRIMIPMITSVTEVQAVKKIINGICRDLDKKDIKYDKDIKIGVMIETPAAAIMADVLAHEVDFFSIGTNDLTQYTLAVDRGNENVAYLYSALNPAVIRSIKHIIECAHNAGIEAGMCGEAAADERMIPLLLNFGLDEFSVTVSRVLETRKEIASWSSKEVKEITENVMNYSEEKEVSNYLSDCIAKE
ncbi:MAG: phosphoenolpyruvate--protein phosphotransferase [Lachnospira pectinoschiza]|jgi:phosphoenolpyruvate-protein phosphotransferase|uniref:phosphoenolpyruvate--protein phosphotransferase n=1 Tax=[Lactobacillus] rogosae TaxID=706562 RepID=UPI0006C36941|nr:phosphoenolpyruvate--protein phosphotransferase [Eubacterium sp.]CUQ77021.1 Phosphoenolpyruvate-protein phosphotransferase [Lachnospira pectinoschiza]